MTTQWQWRHFNELTLQELHDMIHLRERVFIVEQNCVYLDVDGCKPVTLQVQ